MKPVSHARIQERLRKLRQQFSTAPKPHQVDKDFEHLTSDRSKYLAHRTFFLGEIFWVNRAAWEIEAPIGRGSHWPGLVVQRQPKAFQDVPFAPVVSSRLPVSRGAGRFAHEREPAWSSRPVKLRSPLAFALELWRPVNRELMGAHLATLQFCDKDRLAKAMAPFLSCNESLEVE